MENEKPIKEVWLLRVHHPADFPTHAGWSDVGVFTTSQLAQKAIEVLAKAGRICDDANGNSWELKRFDVRG